MKNPLSMMGRSEIEFSMRSRAEKRSRQGGSKIYSHHPLGLKENPVFGKGANYSPPEDGESTKGP